MNSFQLLISQLDEKHGIEIFLQAKKAFQEIKSNFNQSPIISKNDQEHNRNVDIKQFDKANLCIQDLKLFSNESKSKYKNEINYIGQSMRRINFNNASTEQLK